MLTEEYRARYISKNMRQAVANANNAFGNANNADNANNEQEAQELPPAMPSKLPKLIELLTSRTPEQYRPAVAHAVFPSLAAHLLRVTFPYVDGVDREATLMNVLMAGTGAGKSCIVQPINHILADIKRRYEVNRERERRWKEENNQKGANKEKAKRPDGLVIQCVSPDMTHPAFVLRMREADGHFLYARMNEIEQFNSLKGNGAGGQQYRIICLAFDPDNEYGQERVGSQSITEKVHIRFNWNASTTIGEGRRYFQNVLTNGPISRINFCTIPAADDFTDEIPVYKPYDEQFDQDLKPYIDNLMAVTGRISCEEANALVVKLKRETADFARLSQSQVYYNLSFRALVIAWLKACVLYVANGCQWEEEIEEFIRWSLHYDLWCKMEFFGADIADAMQRGARHNHRGPRNMLELLPDRFTLAQVVNIRQQQGLDDRGTKNMLNAWRYRGYIDVSGKDCFVKKK